MSIRDLNDISPATPARPATPADARTSASRTDAGRSARHDRVEISEQARASHARSADGGLSPERIAEIRRRIADGFYDTAHVARAVAHRIIQSGDLQV